MHIRLKNIGLIRDSDISLDGLTVITGKNNSGKTTVGKTLYAILEATSNLRQKAKFDRSEYIKKQLNLVEEELSQGHFFDNSPENTSVFSSFSDYPALATLFFENFKTRVSLQEIEDYAHKVDEELRTIDSKVMETYRLPRVFHRYDKKSAAWVAHEISVEFEEERAKALAILTKLFENLNKDSELTDYAREIVNQTLRTEFNGQIQPIRRPDVVSTVVLSEDGEDSPDYFRFSIANDNIINDGNPVFFASPFKRAYMIDDPFILDKETGIQLAKWSWQESKTIFNPTRIHTHSYRLRNVLRSTSAINTFEQTILNDSLKPIKEQIDRVIPGTFEFSSQGDYYVRDGVKVKISNMATGSKMFSIIRLLLEKGELNSSTMLILDEPEAHLHPQWQNSFAEIIVLLVKELGVNVLLTTHSPNFMLALDAHMRKYSINDLANFYQTDTLEDGFVRYRCVNDDVGLIYDDFLQYLSEMKILRNQYL